MSWAILLVAGLCECGWAIGMKYTCGFTRLWPSVFTVTSMVVSMYLLSVAVKTLPIGTGTVRTRGVKRHDSQRKEANHGVRNFPVFPLSR